MRSFRILNRRAGSLGIAFALFLGVIAAPFASAATVTARSIALSNSTASAPGVAYTVNFTSVAGAGAVVIDFCSDSPLLGQTCTAPAGMNAAAAAASGGFTVASATASKVVVTGTIAATTAISVPLTGITNPSTVGPFYARIVTFTDGTGAGAYTSTTPGTHIDDGGVAMSITNKIGVSAAVLESMTFCVSGETITENCVGSGASAPALAAPTLKLGENNGGVIALDATHLSTGNVYTQISTNAVNGAIVSLKSNTAGCGGLVRAGAASNAAGCGIAPAGTSSFTFGNAKFGVKTATAVGAGSNFNGTFQPFDTAGSPIYNSSGYALNYVGGDATGVTSTYGDPFLETAGAPANNMGMTLTFGASIANNTPAGLYSADLSLVATGKF
jgi:hypothetical protein